MIALSVIVACLAVGGGGRSANNKQSLPNSETGRGGGVRINKVFTEKFSRREADRIVEAGRVTINGRVAKPGDSVDLKDFVKLDGKKVNFPAVLTRRMVGATKSSSPTSSSSGKKSSQSAKSGPVYIVYNKPSGVECTTDETVEGNIVAAVNHQQRVFPVGRLDKDTTGVILLTNDGQLPNACLRAEKGKAKTYLVTTQHAVDPDECRKLATGVVITTTAQSSKSKKPLTARTKPCKVHPLKGVMGGRCLKMVLTEGRNRQVRRMLRAVGHRVTSLHRASFMGIHPGQGLKPGCWRDCNPKELAIIERALAAEVPEGAAVSEDEVEEEEE